MRPSRRSLARGAAGLAAAALAAPGIAGAAEPFWGAHQAGILTPPQHHTYTAAFDLAVTGRDDLIRLLRIWTAAAARLCLARPAAEDADSGETAGLPPSRLTLTFGFGRTLFVKDGKDRLGLAARLPSALIALPDFPGDQLEPARSGGDLSVQACADDPQIAFHAVRQLARLAYKLAGMRWAQSGFRPGPGPGHRVRNLMGFIDGTGNLPAGDTAAMSKFVWVGDEGPQWLQGGSYVVFRRIRVALEHWDRMPLSFQEQAFGRRKVSGAPLGGARASDPLDFARTGSDGEPVIPQSAHVRLASAASNEGARILRRPYNYNDGVDVTTERWEPWRRALEYDAGLFFVCWQRDPRTGFARIYDRLSRGDMLNQFVTHTGGGLFACPPGAAPAEFIGQPLFV